MTAGAAEPAGPPIVLVVGTGLMGTSVALALAESGARVHLADRDPAALALAADLGAGSPEPPEPAPDVVVLAVPPRAVAPAVQTYQGRYPQCIVTDLASTKSHVQAEVEAIADPGRFVGGHPLAGRERSGAGAARADLFQDRPWVLTPVPATPGAAVTAVEDLVRRCGAQPVVMAPQRHDEAVALVSHVPQVAASLVAARLTGADDGAVGLAGQGLRDVTRIAASDPGLWTEILVTNAPAVRAVLLELAADLETVATALGEAGDDPDDRGHRTVTDALRRGNQGRSRLPGKHGAPPATYVTVPVVVPDRPGELARILLAAGEAGVNVEDIAIEHSPGRPVGLVELAVRPEAADPLAAALRAAGWSVHR